ncbi:c-type cytochrome [Piscinibacter sakaiensis]|uniref:c-type cytochrome n=1 Tax=Piscinibacter sakaiensis TaxID=1547922 RepID=UPI00372A1FAC
MVAATAGTVIVLLVSFGASLAAGLALARLDQPGMARVEITGHRWWWEVRYLDGRPERIFTSANELHLPAGRPVELLLRSADVIHSFWAPRLHGKIDLIPGRTNRLVLQAQQTGVHRAQCAEFCGVQHAKMALMVVVRPPDEHARWLASQLAPLAEPADDLAREGRVVFERHCAACHAMRGTAAVGRLGPDLTRFAQRLTVGAGTLPNTPGHRAGWIADAQHVKPGSLMPWVPLQGRELQAVLRYLEAAV